MEGKQEKRKKKRKEEKAIIYLAVFNPLFEWIKSNTIQFFSPSCLVFFHICIQ